MMVLVKAPSPGGGTNIHRFETHTALCVYFNKQSSGDLLETKSRVLVEGSDTVESLAAVMSSLQVYGTKYDVQFEESMEGFPEWLAGVTTDGDDDEF